MKVMLTDLEVQIAQLWAMVRMNQSVDLGLKDYAGAVRSESMDIIGAECELAAAKYLKVYPGFTYGTYKNPDVGKFQVRGTDHQEGRLIIRENDSIDDVFILVVKKSRLSFDIAGWVTGARGRLIGKMENPNDRKPCWFVPQSKLNQMDWLEPYMSGTLKERPKFIQ